MPKPAPLTWTEAADRWTGHCPVLNADFLIMKAKGGMFWGVWPDCPEGRTEDLNALKTAATAHAENMRIVALLGTRDEADDVVWMSADAEPLRMGEIPDAQLPHVLSYVEWGRERIYGIPPAAGMANATQVHTQRILDLFRAEVARRGLQKISPRLT